MNIYKRLMRCAVVALVLGNGVAFAADSLRIWVRGDTAQGMRPLSYQDTTGRWMGLDVELAQVLAQEAGMQLSFHPAPWKRALTQLEKGQLDMAAAMSKTAEREKWIYFLGVSREQVIVLIVPEESSYAITSLDDFKKLDGQVSIRIGSYYGEAFEKKMKSDPQFAAKFDARPDNGADIKKLGSNRVAGFLLGLQSALYLIKTDPDYANVKIHPFVVDRSPLYFGVSKKTVGPGVLERLKKAYARAQATGKFSQVNKRYQE